MKFDRKQWLYGGLVVTMALVAHAAWFSDDSNVDVASSKRHVKLADNGLVSIAGSLDRRLAEKPLKLDRDPLIEASNDPFNVVNFVPPAPPPPTLAPPAPPKPTAPPMPYRFFGTMTDIDGTKTTYLQRGDDLIAIHAQQLIDQDYRIDSVDEHQIVIEYLPLQLKTALNLQTAENN